MMQTGMQTGMMHPGKRNLITDIAGLKVGHADDDALKSGVSVVVAERPFVAGVSILGGAPGTRETPLLEADKLVADIDAIVIAGGSAFGLEAAGGVMDALREAGRGFAVGSHHVPIVPAAILFDLNNGGDKSWVQNPYPALGRAAMRRLLGKEAGADFPLGSHGAGKGALAGDVKGGLGSASLVLEDGVSIGALVAVNAFGSPLVPPLTPGQESGQGSGQGSGQRHFWAALDEIDAEFGGLGAASAHDARHIPHLPKRTLGVGGEAASGGLGAHTTLAVIATDAALDKAACQRLAVAAHDGLARAIRPAHTLFDGDCVFALATGTKPPPDPVGQMYLGHAAALCLARAIGRGIWEASPEEGDLLPTARTLMTAG